MIGKKKARKIAEMAFKHSKADQVEVVMFNYDQSLTRFANNYIHQNVSESNTSVSIRTAFGKKIGSASTNSLAPRKIKETVAWAEKIARFQRANEDFIEFPAVKQKNYKILKTYIKKTDRYSNTERARAVADIVGVAKQHSLTSYGSVSNGGSEVCIANSNGTFAYAVSSDVFSNIVMAADNSTGYAQAGGRDVRNMDFRILANQAAQKALQSINPAPIEPGSYTTIFEPLATSEFLNYLAYYAFNGKMYEEGRSYLSGKIKKKVVDKRITIIDDPFRKTGFAFPFDFEGVPKRKYTLLENGIVKNIVYDSLTASRVGKRSTGHGLAAPNPFGPIPMHCTMKAGKDSLKEMIESTKKGILVTRFHYTNIISPHRLVFTGMTRDGTFLIKNGEVVQGAKNFRFTENIIDCFNRIAGITRKTELVASEPGYGARFATGVIVPAIKIDGFNFTSATEF